MRSADTSSPVARLAGIAILALALALGTSAACGSSTSGSGGGDPIDPSSTFSVPPGGQRTGSVPATAPSGTTFTYQAAPGSDGGVDFAAYDESMNLALGAINEYWHATMPAEFDLRWIPPTEFIAYYPPQDPGPSCAGQAAVPENAVYCGADDFIAWDEPNFMLPYYEEMGDMATAVILAHEFGHGVQDRLGLNQEFDLTIEAELQADCFAGAWAGWADQQGLLGREAVDQAINAVVSLADAPGVAFTDPDAHGTADERLDAFAFGADNGATACTQDLAPGFTG